MPNSIKNSTFLIFLSALFTCVPQLHAPSIATRPDEAFFRGFSQDFTDISRQPPQTSRKKIVLTLLTSPKLWYNVLVTATANAELMKRFRLYSFGSAARPESSKRAKRVI